MLAATIYRRRPGFGQTISPTVTVPTEVSTAIDKLTTAANTLVSAVSNFQIRVQHDVTLPPSNEIAVRLLPAALLITIFMTGTVIFTKKILTADPEPARSRAR